MEWGEISFDLPIEKQKIKKKLQEMITYMSNLNFFASQNIPNLGLIVNKALISFNNGF